MRKIALLMVIILSLAALACSGGGGTTENGNGGANPTPTPATPAESTATILEVRMTAEGLQPQTFQMEAGKSYMFKVVNETARSRNFIVRRWEINVPVEANATAQSGPFSDTEAGAQAVCNDLSRGSLPQWQCTVNIVAGG